MFQRKRIGLCRDSSKIGEPLMRIMGNSRVIGVGNIREFSAVITRSRRLSGIFDVRSSSGTQGGLQTQLIDGRCPPFDLAEGTSSLGGIALHRPFLLAQRIIDLFVPPQGRGIGQEERFNHKPSAREREIIYSAANMTASVPHPSPLTSITIGLPGLDPLRGPLLAEEFRQIR